MANWTRLPEQKYTEAEYFFQTIEMAKSDEEYDVELCSTPPRSSEFVDLMTQEPATIFSWKVVKRRQRPHRRYTVSHSAPPAPPSTPTSLTASSTPTPSPTASSSVASAAVSASASASTITSADDEPLSSLLYILDYAPKYKKKLKEQQRTDAELAELLNVISLTNGGGESKSSKLPPERGVSANSRVIRKRDSNPKIFKVHRNPKEFFREPEEEDSVSAPEYDTEEEDTRFRRLTRVKPSRRLLETKRQRRFARFQQQERMDAILDNFDAAMSFNENV